MSINVLMVGWELPPFTSGGLGVASYGLAKELSKKGVNITFVLPKINNYDIDFMNLVFADIKEMEKLLGSYTYSSKFIQKLKLHDPASDYVTAALRFGERVLAMAKKFDGDIIHCHDWLTFPAGMASRSVMKRPMVAHVHATEIDRTGGNYPNPDVYEIENRGLRIADRVISVSEFTKSTLVRHYSLNPGKISVVHNGVTEMERKQFPEALSEMKRLGYKVVLYHGRITLQKGPEYFIYAARKVLDYRDKVLFVVCGSGDMKGAMMDEAARVGIMNNVIFSEAIWGDEAYRMMQSADLLVMPSVSEPFGIVPLEAVANGTPTLISKQSGVSEVLRNCLKVDFWDIDEMANKIITLIDHSELGNVIVEESSKELPSINWEKAAEKTLHIYEEIL